MRWLRLCLVGSVFSFAGPTALRAGEDSPNQQLLKTDLLVVTAHPDDESMMIATMARYTDEGKTVALVTCTHGEGGGNGTGKESGAALGLVREAELRQCLAVAGVRHLYFLNQLDWAYTESVRATLAKWGHEESLRRLVRLVRLLRPEVICTMDPAPVGGQHGHHQAAGRLATEAFEAAADPHAFPELTQDEGLPPWRVRKLYWFSFGGMGTVRIATDGMVHGKLAPTAAGKRYADIGWEAARHHRSQGFDKFLASLAGSSGNRMPARPNGFLLVKSRLRVDPRTETDLFDGIATARVDGPDTMHDVLATLLPPPAEPNAVTARVRPRENLVEYRTWLQQQRLTRLLPRLPAHVTVVRGQEDNPVEVEVTNPTANQQTGSVTLELPAGWKLEPSTLSYDLPSRTTRTLTFHSSVPMDTAIHSQEVAVRCGDKKENAHLDVVPFLTVRTLANALPVDADPAKWQSAAVEPVLIPHTNSFQGRIGSPSECSGRFFMGSSAEGLQILVDVTDDTVARNIAPDDIKAHWRSSSVEICLDPQPRSENTFQTFKLGIFPEDTTGMVRAARDADAHPGELGRMHSAIRLASRRTPQGYCVEALIPWAEAGVANPASGTKLGFNVLIYHAGKKDARVGEDVGKARLGWSLWPGVPGRPEVWGLAVLK